MDKRAILHSLGTRRQTRLEHSSYVKSILSIPAELAGKALLLTGSEDENIRVWDAEAAWEGRAVLLSTVQGHCDQVSAIRTWRKKDGVIIVSAALDGTLR